MDIKSYSAVFIGITGAALWGYGLHLLEELRSDEMSASFRVLGELPDSFLDCNRVGSLDFDFLGHPGISHSSFKLFAERSTATKVFVAGLVKGWVVFPKTPTPATCQELRWRARGEDIVAVNSGEPHKWGQIRRPSRLLLGDIFPLFDLILV